MKKILSPALARLYALGAGLLGFFLYVWLIKTGVDQTGLLRPSHPAGIILFILIPLVLAVLYLCFRNLDGVPVYKKMFPRSIPYAVGCFVAAGGILIADIIELSALTDRLSILSCIAGVAAAASLVFLGLCNLRRKRPAPMFHGLVTLYLMLHLVSQYRFWSGEPQLQKYFFQLLASVFVMLSAYHRTAVDCSRNNRRLYLFFNYGALFFCCLAVPGRDWLFYLSMAMWTGTCACSIQPVKFIKIMDLPEDPLYCIQKLTEAGYKTYAVGGCVRDSLLDIPCQDYDLCTAATPEQICATFLEEELVRNGEKHGTIGVVLHGKVYEITTFRAEGGYADSRHPDWVRFVTSVKEDLSRRDFTVNAIAYHPDTGYIDPYGGQQDLNDRILRAVGDPRLRFGEDPLRILRGIRFCVQHGLTPEEETMNAMLALAHTMDHLARERVFTELQKFLLCAKSSDLIRFAPILGQVIPELSPTMGFQQHSPHHAYDVYTHTAHTVQATPQDIALRFAALLHDIGKPGTFSKDENGIGHFYDHAVKGSKMANEIMLRLKAPTALRQQVVLLIEQHMTPIEPDKKLLRRRLTQLGEENLNKVLQLQKADYESKGVAEETAPAFDQIYALLEEIRKEDSCLQVKDLAINGNDILDLGIMPGPHIGSCMTCLLELVQDEVIPNTKEELLQAAKQFMEDLQEDDEL